MRRRVKDDAPRWWQSAAGLPYRLEILDSGRKVGLIDNEDGTVICDWPVNPRPKKPPGKKPSKQVKAGSKSRKKKGKQL